jgi:hypothetical protein
MEGHMKRASKVFGLVIYFICIFFSLHALSENLPAPKSEAYKLSQLTKEKFEALPGTAVLEIEGKRITKQQYTADIQREMTRSKSELLNLEASGGKALDKKNADLRASQMARINERNAKIIGKAEPLRKAAIERRSKLEAIQKEAHDLYNKAKTTQTPEAKAQIDKRAGELLIQLKQLGY